MKTITIKTKLVLLFIVIKVIPLLLIAYIAYEGVKQLEEYVNTSTRSLFTENKEIITATADASIEDSIKNLDKKSQTSLEKVSYEMANNVANFLYERDKDILFLSKIPLTQEVLENFYETKNKEITEHGEYIYNDEKQIFEPKETQEVYKRESTTALLKDNEKEFNYIDPILFQTKILPLYKEVNFFDLQGNELYKVSSIKDEKTNVFESKNTYINSESYFKEAIDLKEGEIYVSDVIGEYVGTKVIGTFTKEKAKKAGIEFEPEKYGYAGVENPLGKRFEGIVRFITPVYKSNQKVGYVSLALDHRHIKEFINTSNPTGISSKQNIADASLGNYTFMWDYQGKSIVHPRDYSIVGYDKDTGKLALSWLSADIAEKFYASNKPIDEFLKNYPTFEDQGLHKKPNLKQLKEDGLVGLDCRYLNFAPQCQGWMQLTQHGGYGSFIINWSNVWKLTTAASIPYFTGKYKESPRGFGFIAIGANVDEFHAAANETKKNVDLILETQTSIMKDNLEQNSSQISLFIQKLLNELTVVTFIMIVFIILIALWISNYMTSKINNLLEATKKFANNDFDYRINVSSNDEIGNLEQSFNQMASEINSLILKQIELNEKLEDKVDEKSKELLDINKNLELVIEQRTKDLKHSLLKVQNSDQVKSTFLANMSHEIRTPLNAIIGFSEVLSSNSKIDDDSRKQALIVEDSAKSLLNIINDILDVSKIESGNFEINLSQTSLKDVSKNVFELFFNKAKNKQIVFSYNFDEQTPPCIMSDAIRVKQVLSNLISNSIKFTPNHGQIELNISVLEKSETNARIRFLVKDNGIGIASNNFDKIFETFVQADDQSNRKYEGTGLGLSICQHIIQSLNSSLKVESTVGEGSVFWFDLNFDICEDSLYLKPLEDISNENKNENENLAKAMLKGKILIAEDNILNQELIKYFLEELNLEYTMVANGLHAVEKFKEDKFAMILMDINMPILNGLEAFKIIREYEKENNLKPIFITAITANDIQEQKDKYLEYGMNEYLIKPLSFDVLKKLIFDVLSKNINEDIKENELEKPEVKEIKETEKIISAKKTIEVNFDKKHSMEQLGLDEATVDMLLDNFFLTLDFDILKLENAIASSKPESIIHAAHYLKSSAGNLAMREATLLLDKIEAEARNGKDIFDENEIEDLKYIFKRVKESI